MRTYADHTTVVYALEWLDSDTLASSGFSDRTIRIWSATSGQTKRVINVTNSVYVYCLKMLASSSSTSFYLAAGLSSDINIYSLNEGTLLSTLQGHTSSVFDLVQLKYSIRSR